MSLPRARIPSEQDSLGDLVQRLRTDVTRIVETELRLIRVRMQAGSDAVRAAGLGLVFAGALGLAGFGAIAAGFVVVLGTVLPVWIAAFAVGGGFLVVAGIIVAVEIRVIRHGVNEALASIDDFPGRTGHGG